MGKGIAQFYFVVEARGLERRLLGNEDYSLGREKEGYADKSRWQFTSSG